MSKKTDVALPVIRRLPRYYRFISSLIEEGTERISSGELSKKMGLTASQIRQDFNCFGGFGQQGYGYNLISLKQEIADIIGIEKKIDIVLVGAGNMGRAVANKINFDIAGFNLVGIFDNSPQVIGNKLKGIYISEVSEIEAFCKNNAVKAAIICVPDDSAKPIIDKLVDNGIKIFWNFTHYDILINHPDKGLTVENVHLNDSLMALRFLLDNN